MARISVNEKELMNAQNISGKEDVYVYAADFNSTDKCIDIILKYQNDTDDCFLKIAKLEGNEAKAAKFKDIYSDDMNDTLYVSEYGALDTEKMIEAKFNVLLRSDLFATWSYEAEIKLKEGYVFEPSINEMISMEDIYEKEIVAAFKLKAYAKKDEKSEEFIIPAGEKIKLIKTDMINWVNIKAGEKEGWFKIEDESTLKGGTYIFDAFEGLNFVD